MYKSPRRAKLYLQSYSRSDLKASITVFFVALPLCLGISLASGVPIYSGLVSGIVGGLIIPFISRSPLSVSGPAAGLTAICTAAVMQLGNVEVFFITVCVAGLLQVLLGIFKLGGFTHFIPSAVIKGMLTAIGVLLISKQIPLVIGYDRPDFWTDELFNIFTFHHAFTSIENFMENMSPAAILIAGYSTLFLFIWNKWGSWLSRYVPVSFLLVAQGILIAYLLQTYFPSIALSPDQYVQVPENFLKQVRLPDFQALFSNALIWKYGVIICFVATLETLLSIEAIDKLDPYNRVTPQNRELIAQGTGNFLSGLSGGLPITAVIVRSSANAEAGARTSVSAFLHGLWLFLVLLFAASLVNLIPYCVLAVILIRTGYNLAKPKMVKGVYRQGREQFLPFLVTVIAILTTDLLIGVGIGVAYSIYFLVKHTYRAGYTLKEKRQGNIVHYTIDLALNVSFLNKKRFVEMLDRIPPYSEVEIIGSESVYIDHDILEIFHDFKSKAHRRHIELKLIDIPDVETIELH